MHLIIQLLQILFKKNGNIIPLLPLIGAIAAGITALASASEATASAVISAKNFAK